MEGSLGPIQGDCPSNVLDGDLMLARLVRDDSQQVQGIGLIRLDGENLPVDLLGSL